eukprot:351150-Chlamydomonas_euryale.AAC.2
MDVDNVGPIAKVTPPPRFFALANAAIAQAGSCHWNCAAPAGHVCRQRRVRHFLWIAPTQLQRAVESPPHTLRIGVTSSDIKNCNHPLTH